MEELNITPDMIDADKVAQDNKLDMDSTEKTDGSMKTSAQAQLIILTTYKSRLTTSAH